MNSQLNILTKNGFNVSSPVSCVTQVSNMVIGCDDRIKLCEELTDSEFTNRIKVRNDVYAKVLHQYLVCELVINNIKRTEVTTEELYATVFEKTDKMYNRMTDGDMQYMTKTDEETDGVVSTSSKPVRTETKAQKAEVIFRNNPTLSRKEIVGLFMTELGMSSAGASTYHQNMKAKVFGTK